MALYLSGDTEADDLLTNDPFALLIGMVLDQQIPLERAFAAPLTLRTRLKGKLDPKTVAKMDTEKLVAIFCETPALHRFPAAMAERVQRAAQIVVDEYKGDASKIWSTAADGSELMKNLKAIPGFGPQKAQIFAALLAKRLGIRPTGWEKVTGPYGKAKTFMSIADIDGPAARERVREHKREMKAAAKAAAAK